MQKNGKFVPLSSPADFWLSELTPISAESVARLERQHSLHLPDSLRDLYLVSNGGQTEYIYYVLGDRVVSLFQNGTLLPFDKWELISPFLKGFDLDDEKLIEVANNFSQARIISRYGFEYFVLIVPSTESSGGWIGQLDLATTSNEKPNIKIICKADELVSGLCALL